MKHAPECATVKTATSARTRGDVLGTATQAGSLTAQTDGTAVSGVRHHVLQLTPSISPVNLSGDPPLIATELFLHHWVQNDLHSDILKVPKKLPNLDKYA